MNYLSNIRVLYAYSFFHSLIPAYVIERLYWEDRGMTVLMVVFTEMIYGATIVLMEVPTGILADKWSRKNLIIVSAALASTEFIILIFASSFWHFAAFTFLAGVSKAAFSGSANALLYDSLKKHGHERHFEKHIGILNVFDFTAAIIAALSGSFLAGLYGFELNYWLSFGSALACFAATFMLKESSAVSDGGREPAMPIRKYLTESFRFFKTRPDVCLALLPAMASGAAINYIYEFWQLYLERIDIPVTYFGVVSAGIMVLALPGNLLAGFLLRRFSLRALLTAVLLVFTAGYTFLSIARNTAGLLAIFIICLAYGVVSPAVTGYLHHRTESGIRATVDSFHSLGLNAARIATGLGFGFLSSRLDIFGGYGFIAVTCGAALVLFGRYSKCIE